MVDNLPSSVELYKISWVNIFVRTLLSSTVHLQGGITTYDAQARNEKIQEVAGKHTG